MSDFFNVFFLKRDIKYIKSNENNHFLVYFLEHFRNKAVSQFILSGLVAKSIYRTWNSSGRQKDRIIIIIVNNFTDHEL